jgi:pimeloyl-ACP methyl ester carboxylesterase
MIMAEHALIDKDMSMFYSITGEGESVVLLHGFAEDSMIWDDLVSHISANHKVICVDFRGSGRSTGNMDGVTMESLADDVNRIFEKEQIHQAYMIGHSMGGYVALAFAEKYPEKLKGLGLFHSTAFADNDEKKEARKKNADFIRKHGTVKFLEQSVPNLFADETKQKHPHLPKQLIERYSNFSPASLVAYTLAMMNRPDRTEILKTVKCPVLLIIGEFDTAVPMAQSLKLCALADFTYIYIAAHSGHMGMLEEPEFCLKAIQDFLSGN